MSGDPDASGRAPPKLGDNVTSNINCLGNVRATIRAVRMPGRAADGRQRAAAAMVSRVHARTVRQIGRRILPDGSGQFNNGKLNFVNF